MPATHTVSLCDQPTAAREGEEQGRQQQITQLLSYQQVRGVASPSEHRSSTQTKITTAA